MTWQHCLSNAFKHFLFPSFFLAMNTFNPSPWLWLFNFLLSSSILFLLPHTCHCVVLLTLHFFLGISFSHPLTSPTLFHYIVATSLHYLKHLSVACCISWKFFVVVCSVRHLISYNLHHCIKPHNLSMVSLTHVEGHLQYVNMNMCIIPQAPQSKKLQLDKVHPGS